MAKSMNLIGEQYGKLTVIAEGKIHIQPSGQRKRTWLCKCDCGNEITVFHSALRSGITKSCGCLRHNTGSRFNLVGQRFGRLVVLEEVPTPAGERSRWRCACDCGNKVIVSTHDLHKKNNTQSCGCLQREIAAKTKTIHGLARDGAIHPIYSAHSGMIQRCENPNNSRYHRYGGRGITVCDEWHNPKIFYDWAINNGWSPGLTIERIDNNGNYEPSNCCWIIPAKQASNRHTNDNITWHGKTQNLTAWGKELHIPQSRLWARLYRNHWTIERAFTTPTRKQEKNTHAVTS